MSIYSFPTRIGIVGLQKETISDIVVLLEIIKDIFKYTAIGNHRIAKDFLDASTVLFRTNEINDATSPFTLIDSNQWQDEFHFFDVFINVSDKPNCYQSMGIVKPPEIITDIHLGDLYIPYMEVIILKSTVAYNNKPEQIYH